jgi:hypothetical protein
MKVTMAQSIDRNRGICSTCQYFSARLFENGNQRFVCRKDNVFLKAHVAECTDYQRKNNGLFGDAAWQVGLNTETGIVEFRDPNYRTFHLVEGKPVRIKPKDDDD